MRLSSGQVEGSTNGPLATVVAVGGSLVGVGAVSTTALVTNDAVERPAVSTTALVVGDSVRPDDPLQADNNNAVVIGASHHRFTAPDCPDK